jgi:hypothetical protein
MTVLRVQLCDYTTDAPVGGVRLFASAIAVGAWLERPPIAPGFDPPVPGFDPVRPAPDPHFTRPEVTITARAGANRTEAVRRTIQRRVSPPGADVTDAAGMVEFEWSGSIGSPLWEAIRQVESARTAAPASYYVAFLVGVQLDSGIQYVVAGATGGPDLDDTVDAVIHWDLAWTAVGHVTPTTAKLWFRSNIGDLPWGESLTLEMWPAGVRRRLSPLRTVAVADFDRTWGDTRTIEVTDLAPGTAYQYRLVRYHLDASPTVLCRGGFRTEPIGGISLRLAFGSCHEVGGAELTRWQAMAQYRPDLVLLIGDQIYGDGCERVGAQTWMDAYVRRYLRTWRPAPVRQVLGSQSVLMMLDDHDVKDDWGTTFTVASAYDRVEGAMKAFHAFAGDRNPGPPRRADWARTAVDFPFSWDFVRGYALDLRTQRGLDLEYPVLGRPQLERFARWATTEAVRADVVIVAIPVPLAYINGVLAKEIVDFLPTAGGAAGALVGYGIAAGLTAEPGWLFAGAVIGWAAGQEAVEGLLDGSVDTDAAGRVTEPDLADQWDAEENRADLERVLKILFDLANASDTRVVVVLSGDTHTGSVHRIYSVAAEHERVRNIYQVVASPIGHAPSGSAGSMQSADATVAGNLFSYRLAGPYHAELMKPDGWEVAGVGPPALIDERNYGTVRVTKQHPDKRNYWIRMGVWGDTQWLDLHLDYRLDESGQPTVDFRTAPGPF